MSIVSIEDLSNELFYEIFEYLDSGEIYQAFFKLNHRFQQLLNSSSLLLKIKLYYSESKETMMNNYKHIFLYNKNQVLSIHLWLSTNNNQIMSSFTIDLSFIRLESLVFSLIEPDLLISLLPKLTNLPRLFSLTIDTWSDLKDLGNIYQLIFNLPKLRYIKYIAMESNDVDITISLPIATNKQVNAIEYLIIDHPCAYDELSTIISYTPQLRRLKFLNLSEKEFYLKYNAHFDDNYETPMYIGKQDQFSSLFWIERQWILEIEIEYDNLMYSIRPYKKRWYEYNTQHTIINSFVQLSKSTRLILVNASPEGWSKSLTINKYINHALTVTKIHHIEIHEELSIGKLSEILYLLPELDSLQIFSLSFSQSTCLSKEELEGLLFLSTKNRITKLFLKKITLIEELYFLMEIFPHINHLQVNLIYSMDIELFVRLILIHIMTKSNHPLRLLCFPIVAADDEMVQKLEKMINVENLLFDFMMKRVINEIYLQWK
ncbi:unnamed protein product [Rotaria sp. Silwood1]|nr:unnamed protein product [Rotaria sp. Silwood1]